jgi:hypothetical protein
MRPANLWKQRGILENITTGVNQLRSDALINWFRILGEK